MRRDAWRRIETYECMVALRISIRPYVISYLRTRPTVAQASFSVGHLLPDLFHALQRPSDHGAIGLVARAGEPRHFLRLEEVQHGGRVRGEDDLGNGRPSGREAARFSGPITSPSHCG